MKRHPQLRFWILSALVVSAIVVAFGCSDQEPLSPNTVQTQSPLHASKAVTTAQEIFGEIGPGAKYGLFVPQNWNGDLALYAHGFIDPASPIDLPTANEIVPLRDQLVELGYAVAYSSYSENGLAVKDGAQRTQQLRGIFVSKVGKPGRTYLMGHSLGGLVAIMLAEKHPKHYAGALVMCGMVGGSQPEIDYVANVRVLFDFFYPGVLPGNALDIPDGVDLMNDVVFPVIAAIQADPTGAGTIPFIQQTPVPFSTPQELVESFVRALGFNFRGFQDVFDRTHNHNPFDNSITLYTGPLPAPVVDAINAGVDRFETTPDAANYLRHYYQPSGNLEIPVLTLHNVLDPVVPIFHETMYQQIVATAGKSDLLVQRTVNLYGHCVFGSTPEEEVTKMVQAFQDLANWVENGVKPLP